MEGQGSLNTTQLLDAVRYIELHGLARDNNGNQKPLRLPRETYSVKPAMSKTKASHDATFSPPPPPSPKSDLVLSLSVLQQIHEDRHATVYEVEVVNKDKLDVFVPPLVIKVAKILNGRRVAEESGIYDVLKPLQGVVTPRCYGYFRSKINHQEMTIKPWDPECDNEQPRPPLDIFDMPNVASSLNILLLEAMGPELKKVHEQNPLSLQDLREEVTNICKELLPQAVLVNIARPKKVCLAPGSRLGSPGLPSPKHKWRLVGFGEAEISDMTEEKMEEDIRICVRDLIKALSKLDSNRSSSS